MRHLSPRLFVPFLSNPLKQSFAKFSQSTPLITNRYLYTINNVVKPHSIYTLSHKFVHIGTFDTPNPQSLKFVPNFEVINEDRNVSSVVITSQKEAQEISPTLAYPLLCIEGVSHVMLGGDFVTVTIGDGYDWLSIKPQITQILREFGDAKVPALSSTWTPSSATEHPINPDDEEAVALIKEIIELRVRPSVMEDGGDIEFVKFDENRIVWLLMKGSCSGCPSSGATLKQGIQNMLMHYVPEVEGVEEYVDTQLQAVSEAALAKLEESLAAAKKEH